MLSEKGVRIKAHDIRCAKRAVFLPDSVAQEDRNKTIELLTQLRTEQDAADPEANEEGASSDSDAGHAPSSGDEQDSSGSEADVGSGVSGDQPTTAPTPAPAPQPTQEELNAQLLKAALAGDEKAVKDVLDRGAKINARLTTTFGVSGTMDATALWFAAHKNHLAVVSLLLERGANASLKDSATQRTPLDIVKYHPDKRPIKVLLLQHQGTWTSHALRWLLSSAAVGLIVATIATPSGGLAFAAWWNLFALATFDDADSDDRSLNEQLFTAFLAPLECLWGPFLLLDQHWQGPLLTRIGNATYALFTLPLFRPLQGMYTILSSLKDFLKLDTKNWSGITAKSLFGLLTVALTGALLISLVGVPFFSAYEFMAPILSYIQAVHFSGWIALTWLSAFAVVNYRYAPSQRSIWLPFFDGRVNNNLSGDHMYWLQSRGDLSTWGQILSFGLLNVGAWGLTITATVEKIVDKVLDYVGGEERGPSSQWWLLNIPYGLKLAASSALFVVNVPLILLSDLHDAVFDFVTRDTLKTATTAETNPYKPVGNGTTTTPPGTHPSNYEQRKDAYVQVAKGNDWHKPEDVMSSGLRL